MGNLPAGDHALRLTSVGVGPAELDGFAIVESAQADAVRFVPMEWQPAPEIETGPQPNTLILKYADVSTYYGLAWTGENSEVRQILSDELDRTLRYFVHEHVQKVLRGQGSGHFTNAFVRPIPVPPHASRVLYGMVCAGTREEVSERLAAFAATPVIEHEAVVVSRRRSAVSLPFTPDGQSYVFSQERMAATLLTNVVYPVYTRRRYIRHFTPGKWWDCLYTWDSGFIALGLLELDIERAIDCLNAYTTPPGDPQAAFIHHGSPAPIQIYAFLELWNRTQDRALLEYFYPRLRQMYLFLAGRLGSSTTRRMKSGLLKTWDYFYNSAGWDDYPPQVHVHRHGLEPTVTPVINTSHALRSARILQMAARALGLPDDITDYETDIAAWTDALNRYAWDADAGYFSYVTHDAEGRPTGILRHESGANYDMGLDGASPLFAGVCNAEQEAALIARLTSSEAHVDAHRPVHGGSKRALLQGGWLLERRGLDAVSVDRLEGAARSGSRRRVARRLSASHRRHCARSLEVGSGRDLQLLRAFHRAVGPRRGVASLRRAVGAGALLVRRVSSPRPAHLRLRHVGGAAGVQRWQSLR